MRDDLEEEVEKTMEVEKAVQIEKLLEKQDVAKEEVLVARNGTIISDKHELEDGDRIKVMDVIAGG